MILLYYLLEALKWLIVARALMSWFVSPTSDNDAVRLVRKLTDPILRPIANVLPTAGTVDLSPIVAFLAILLVQRLVLGLA